MEILNKLKQNDNNDIFSMLRIVARRSLALTVQKRMDPIQAIFVNKVIFILTL